MPKPRKNLHDLPPAATRRKFLTFATSAHAFWSALSTSFGAAKWAVLAAVFSTLYALPAGAQSLPRTVPGTVSGAPMAPAGAVSWVQMTGLSVALVLALWAMLSSLRRIAERMRWVSAHQSARLRRALQVSVGGLLLMAVFIPYLAEHYPLIALSLLPALGLLLMLVFNQRAPQQVADQTPN